MSTALHSASSESCSLLPGVGGANIFLTLDCNLACPYCYVDKRRSTMEPAVVEATIDLVAEFARRKEGFFHIGFLGGEPFLRFELLRYVTDELEARSGRPLSFTVTTNGSVLTDEIINWIRERGIRLVLSLDGDRAAMDQRPFRRSGRGSYDSVVVGLRKLQAADVPFIIQMTVSRDNVARLAENLVHVVGLGARSIILGLASNDDWTQTERAALIRGYGQVFEFYKDVFRAGIDVHLKFVNDEVTGFLLRHHLREDPMSCGMLRSVVAVGVNGDVYPCQAMVNFADQRVGDVVNGLDSRAIVGATLPDTRTMPRCSECALRSFCRKCVAFNRAAGPELLDNPSVTCTAGRTTAVLALDFATTMLAEANPRFLQEFAAALRIGDVDGPPSSKPCLSEDLLELLLRTEPLADESELPRWIGGLADVPAIPEGDYDDWVPRAPAGGAGEGRGKVSLEFGAYRQFSKDAE